MFPPGFSCLVVLVKLIEILISFPTSLSLSLDDFSKIIRILFYYFFKRALSISLAATLKIDVSFFSSGYLDVSVLPVLPLYTILFIYRYLRFA